MATKKFPIGKVLIIIISILVVLTGAYFGGFLYLKQYTQASYERLNCEESITSTQRLTQYYPNFLTANVINNELIEECQAFDAATVSFAENSWETAYQGYQVYLEQYPDGHFAGTAQRNAQKALFEWGVLLNENGNYEAAIEKFDILLESEIPLVLDEDVDKLRLEAYLAWVKELRAASAYDQVIARVEQIKSLSQNAYPEIETAAQIELAGVYLDWGNALLDEGTFDVAEEKFLEAMRLDPSPDLPSSPSTQAKSRLVDLYMQWGDSVLESGDYEKALGFYRKVDTLTGKQDTELQQAIAKVYIAWAKADQDRDDFKAALQRLKLATLNEKIDGAKTLIDEAVQNTQLAFSQSSGTQAAQAMIDTADEVCKGRDAEFQIFGLNSEKKMVFLQEGTDESITEPLPDDLKATTPGEMHYVACITVKMDVKEQSSKYGNVTWLRYRQTPTWEITLRSLVTGEIVEEGVLVGTPPGEGDNPSGQLQFNYGGGIQVKFYYIGGYPKFSALVEWITEAIK